MDARLSATSSHGQLVISLTVPSLSLSSVKALVDSGATDSFVDSAFVRKHGIKLLKLPGPRPLRLFDGGLAPSGPITHFVELDIRPPMGPCHGHRFLVTLLDHSVSLVLGIDWLSSLNPSIDWKSPTIRFHHVS